MRCLFAIVALLLAVACPRKAEPEKKVVEDAAQKAEDAAVKMDAVVIESGSPLD